MPKKHAFRKQMGSPSPKALIRSVSGGSESAGLYGGFDDMLAALEDPSASIRPLFRGIVKIFCTFSEPSFLQPWTMKPQSKGTGSGFIVAGRKIITNAHVVAYQTSVQVRKHGDAQKYPGRVIAVAHECDVAILTVDDPEFWAGAVELEFAPMPRLQQEVFVVGYPIGGDTISITSGVVSRVDFDSYAHSTREHLVCSVDAAINPGNSGGPAISTGGKVVGIAFQSLAGAEATGYIIPTPVVAHVLEDLSKHGRLTGFARLGFLYQPLESMHLRQYLKVPKGVTGVLVIKTLPMSNLHKVLERNDIVAAIDGKKVADDGTVVLRDEDRIDAGYLLTNKFIGDPLELTVYRNGEKKVIKTNVEDVPDLVPTTLYERKPQYLVHAGLVFTAATDPFLESFGGTLESISSLKLFQLSTEGEMQEEGEQVVVLANLVAHPINTGYEDSEYVGLPLKKINDTKIKNMVEAAKALKESSGSWTIFEFEGGLTIVLPTEGSAEATTDILRQQSIPARMSADLLVALGEPVPDSMAPASSIYVPPSTALNPDATLMTPSSEATPMRTPTAGAPSDSSTSGGPVKHHGRRDHRTHSVSSTE